MTTKYLILNETTFHGTDQVSTEPTSLHRTLQGAMDAIHEIAEDLEVIVEEDANSVTAVGEYGTGIESDEYYIIEIEEKD